MSLLLLASYSSTDEHAAGMACLLEHNAALCNHNTVVYHVNKQYHSCLGHTTALWDHTTVV